jgi:NAD-dependent dihydropyrimidine dehydrogenase PreA subunit
MSYPKSIVGVILLVFIISTDSLSQSSGGFGWSEEASSPSLTGIVYEIAESSSKIPADLLYQIGVIHTAALDVQPEAAKNGFLGQIGVFSYFAISYNGYFRVTQDGLYKFRLASDDGSVLYIDGREIINNDGRHGIKSGSGKKNLAEGIHSISVDYFQAGGKAALQLFWTPPSGSEKIFKPKWVDAEGGMVAVVNREECQSCGICVEECPYEAIALDDEEIAMINKNKCRGCKRCIEACPVEAIYME